MSKKTFLRGAAILGIAGLLVQVMGAIFRIPLGNIIGDEGMGYYQTAYPIYVFLLVFSTNGAPAAISKMTSERVALGQHSEAYRVFKLSFVLMFALGIVASSIFFFGAERIVTLLKNPGAYYSMLAIAPALLFVPIMSVFRGYFQGLQEMEPTAVSQLAEQAVRVAVGLTLAIVLVPKGIEYASAGATIGTSIGPIAGVFILLIIYYLKKGKLLKEISRNETNTIIEKESAGKIIGTLAAIAVPITIGVSILPIMNVVDVAIVMRRLQDVGYSLKEANAFYGQLTGMAGPVINIPMALALSIALSMVPAIAAANSTRDLDFLNTNIKLGLRTAMIIGVPCTFGLMSLAEPIMLLIYPMQAESASSAAPCLFYLAIGIIFLAIAQTMAGILQGLGKPYTAVAGLGLGVLVKAISTYILTGIPALNVQGAAIGSTVAYGVIGIFNFVAVKKLTNTKFDIGISVWKPLLSGVLMCICVLVSYYVLEGVIGNSLSTVISIGIGAAVYGVMLIKTKSISPHEIRLLPKGEKLAALLSKLRLI
ncbi:putative polysaccharide biosynthesis protein [Sinanaerobacter chloroacetimidivorans]|uniref:Polysaccharide biosynthesis protein n=1 Tax=Sinanaerobacter chloroacetimidivorans TaxID=2818044 RepID=A0A8J8B2J9_9FIRM|nr:polysaccharide biosynthesis protein [Sinanaerobacter chloroacetimidivorans]MBR0598826.1 polysaccharide biosynthesis protein [Sinanaerobacter chloroacetimidivorans]